MVYLASDRLQSRMASISVNGELSEQIVLRGKSEGVHVSVG